MTINLHIVRNGVSNDSRVLKETASLRDSGLFESVQIAGFEQEGLDEREELDRRKLWRIPIKSRRLGDDLASQTVKFAEWAFRIVTAYRKEDLTVIHCNDLAPLPIAVWLKKYTGAKIIYDAHELETERANSTGVRKLLLQRTEHQYIRYVDAMLTVSPSIRHWYESRYSGIPVYLVRNVPMKPEPGFRPMDLRGRFKVPSSSLLFIYLGGHARGRGIELILRAFSLPGVKHHVVFVGEGVLAKVVQAAATEHENIHWLPPVSPELVIPVAAGADVGLSLIEEVSLSYRFSLPNKLFECWMAGIPVMVSGTPDQTDLVTEYNAGWVAPPDPTALGAVLRDMTLADLAVVRVGVEELQSAVSWQNEAKVLRAAYEKVLNQRD